MRRGFGALELVIGSIVILALAGILIALLTQTNMQGTVASLQSCDGSIIESAAGPLLGENTRLECFSSRFEPKFPKEEGKDCPTELGFEEKDDDCVSDGSKKWQYLLKLGCPEERPYCWSEREAALSVNQLITAEQKIEEQSQPVQEVNKEVCIGSGDPSNRLTRNCVGQEPGYTFSFSGNNYECVKTQETNQVVNGERSVYCSSERTE